MLGLAVSFVGVLAIVSHGEWARLVGLNLNQGDLIAFLATVSWALYPGAARPAHRAEPLWPADHHGDDRPAGHPAVFVWEVTSRRVVRLNTATLATFALCGRVSVGGGLFVLQLWRGRCRLARAGDVHPPDAGVWRMSTVFLGETLAWYHLAGISAIFWGCRCPRAGSKQGATPQRNGTPTTAKWGKHARKVSLTPLRRFELKSPAWPRRSRQQLQGSFSTPELVRDLIIGSRPGRMAAQPGLFHLEKVPGSYVTEDFRHRARRRIVWRVKVRGEWIVSVSAD